MFTVICHDFCFEIIKPSWPAFHNNFDPHVGVRIGEASVPGPPELLTITVSNPTCLSSKRDAYAKLGSAIHCVSETSMTKLAQHLATKHFKTAGYKCHWGSPVLSQRLNKLNQPTLRGLSTGVAILTKCSALPPLDSMPPEWLTACCVCECMVRLGHFVIKMVCVYGWQASAEDSKSHTNALLGAALQRCLRFPGLSMVCGDFNHEPCSLPIWDELVTAGFCDAAVVARERWPRQVFPTCWNSTSNDTLLAPRSLIARMSDFRVHIDKMFDCHALATATFDLPVDGLFCRRWDLPATLDDLEVSAASFESAYLAKMDDSQFDHLSTLACSDPDKAYRRWCGSFESSVDEALRQQTSSGTVSCLRWEVVA